MQHSRWLLTRSLAVGMIAVPLLAADDYGAGDSSAPGSPNSSVQGAARSPAEAGGTQDQHAPYSTVRWDENYGFLKDPAQRTDWLDPIKYIPLNDEGDWYLSLGAQIRDRYEYFNNVAFGSGRQDRDGYNLFRFLPYVDLHLGPNFRVFTQFRTVLESGRQGGPRGRDMDTAELQQGFFEFDTPLGSPDVNLSLKIGRQQMVFGKERLIGISEWSNAQRNYDAVRATLTSPGNTLDVLYFRPVNVEKYEFDNSEGHTNFTAIYDTLALSGPFEPLKSKLSLYAFALNENRIASWPTVAGGKGSEDRYTLGTEWTGKPGNFDYDVELDYQLGSFRSHQIDAFSIATEAGYTVHELAFTPRFFLGFDLASGDHNPNNGHLGTFNQLFPSGHTHFGYMDYIGRQNIIDPHPGIDVTLIQDKEFARKLAFKAEYHQFWRESSHDAIYDTSGAIFRNSGTATSRVVGGELDLLLNWQIDQHLSAYFGYSHFFPGTFIRESGPSKQSDFGYAALIYTF